MERTGIQLWSLALRWKQHTSTYFVYFPAIFEEVVPVQQLCEHGDIQSFSFTRHNLGGVYRAS